MSQSPPAFADVAPVQLEHKARMRILGAVMVGIFLAALDQTVVGTALPRIISDLAGNELYTWAITAYLLTSTSSGPIYGKLSDLYGRRPIFLTGIAIFCLGSLLAGISQEMWQLVLTRGIQGLGAGALFPIALAVIGDLFAPSERGRYQGLFGAVFGLSTLVGPALGGLITDTIGWHWVFFLNLPIGAFVFAVVWKYLPSYHLGGDKPRIDYVGAALFTAALVPFLIGLTNKATAEWTDVSVGGLMALGFVILIAFLAWELTDEHPIVDLRIFRYRSFALSTVALFFTFGSFMGSIVLIPLWLQTSMGYTATTAGQMMAWNGLVALFLAPIVANLIGKVDPRFLMSLGLGLVALDTFWRTTFNTDISFWGLVPAQMALGLGMPLFFLPMMSMSMGAVKPEETASAAGLINFLRTMAGAFATGVIVFAWRDSTAASHVDIAGSLNNAPKVLAQMQAAGQGHQQALMSLDGIVQTQSVMLGTNQVFSVVAVILACVSAGVWLMPKPKLAPMKMGGGH